MIGHSLGRIESRIKKFNLLFICVCVLQAGARCVFPFTFDGETYHKCGKYGGAAHAWCGVAGFDADPYNPPWGFCESAPRCIPATTKAITKAATTAMVAPACPTLG